MERIPILYKGEDFLLLFQYASGYCEIVKDGEAIHQIKLVHFSEVILKTNDKNQGDLYAV